MNERALRGRYAADTTILLRPGRSPQLPRAMEYLAQCQGIAQVVPGETARRGRHCLPWRRCTNYWYSILPTTSADQANRCQHQSSILYVSRNRSENRDWVSWTNDGISPVWKEHLRLNVFKSQQPGTVRIGVAGNRSGARIKRVVGPDDPNNPWAIWFWAYPRPAPETRMISIAIYDNRGFIFGSEREVEEDDWQSVFYLWFPV